MKNRLPAIRLKYKKQADALKTKHSRVYIRFWQFFTIFLLLIGYTGYYFCRSYFNVIKPELVADPELGLDVKQIGLIVSFGTFFYAVGKFASGVIGDFVGGKLLFVAGMIGSAFCTIYFGLGVGFNVFITAWALNRLLQSGGWNGVVKIASAWFSYRRYGTVMGILSLSYLFGDALARYVLGVMLEDGYNWRAICFWAAAILAFVSILCWIFLSSSPNLSKAKELEVNPLNVYGAEGSLLRPQGILQLLVPYFESPGFWLVLIMSLGMTLMRETFNDWSTTYFARQLQLSSANSAKYSALFPLLGGISALVAGFFSDFIAKGKKGLIIMLCNLILTIIFFSIYYVGEYKEINTILIIFSLIALFLVGPYTFLSGAISIDLGGKKGSSTAAGMIDSAGYFGGIIAGIGVARLVVGYGWQFIFLNLSFVSIATAIAALLYWRLQEKKTKI